MGSFGVTSIRVHFDRGGTADALAALWAPDGRPAADTGRLEATVSDLLPPTTKPTGDTQRSP